MTHTWRRSETSSLELILSLHGECREGTQIIRLVGWTQCAISPACHSVTAFSAKALLPLPVRTLYGKWTPANVSAHLLVKHLKHAPAGGHRSSHGNQSHGSSALLDAGCYQALNTLTGTEVTSVDPSRCTNCHLWRPFSLRSCGGSFQPLYFISFDVVLIRWRPDEIPLHDGAFYWNVTT